MASKKAGLSILDVYNRMKKYDEDSNDYLDIEEFEKFFKQLLSADTDDIHKIFWKMIDDELGEAANGIEYKKLYLAMLNEGNTLKTKQKVTTKRPILDEEGNLTGKEEKITREQFVDDEEKILDWLWEYGGAVDEDEDIDYDTMADLTAHTEELDNMAADIFATVKGPTAKKAVSPKPGRRKGPPPKKKGPTTKPGIKSKTGKRTGGPVRKGKRTAGKATRSGTASPGAKKGTPGAKKGKRVAKKAPAKKAAASPTGAVKAGAAIVVTDGKYKGKKGVTEKFLASKKKWGCKLEIGKKVLLSEDQFKLS